MDSNNNFQLIVEKAMQVDGRSHMRPVIEKELLHYDILFALDKEGFLDNLTFQGGTSLRLCYGAPRFSEDLDFTGGYDFSTTDLMNMKNCIEHYIGHRYGLDVSVKNPKDMTTQTKSKELKVNKWQIRVVTSPERKDIPKQMIKIDVINIPSYTHEPQSIKQHYEFLPDGYSDTLIMVETLDEILADKLIWFVNCRAYVRHRDIWDMHWLKQQGAILNIDFVQKKIIDYRIDDYSQRLDDTLSQLPSIVHGNEFKAQMSRFIPTNIQERTLSKDKFYLFLENEISKLLTEVRSTSFK